MPKPTNGTEQELREARQRATDTFLGSHIEKHDMEQEAVRIALDAEKHRLEDHRLAHAAAHAAHEELHDVSAKSHLAQHIGEQRAVEAASTSMDKRLDEMNKFRDQLRDQAATFVRRDQLDAFIASYQRAHDEVLGLVATEREERREQQNLHTGAADTWKWIAGFLGVGGVSAVLWALLQAPK